MWRDHNSFAIAQHKHHRSVYQEAEAVKRRKRYARPLVDKHMDVYRKEGLKPWSAENLPLPSGTVMSRAWIHLKFAKLIQVLKDTTNLQ